MESRKQSSDIDTGGDHLQFCHSSGRLENVGYNEVASSQNTKFSTTLHVLRLCKRREHNNTKIISPTWCIGNRYGFKKTMS